MFVPQISMHIHIVVLLAYNLFLPGPYCVPYPSRVLRRSLVMGPVVSCMDVENRLDLSRHPLHCGEVITGFLSKQVQCPSTLEGKPLQLVRLGCPFYVPTLPTRGSHSHFQDHLLPSFNALAFL